MDGPARPALFSRRASKSIVAPFSRSPKDFPAFSSQCRRQVTDAHREKRMLPCVWRLPADGLAVGNVAPISGGVRRFFGREFSARVPRKKLAPRTLGHFSSAQRNGVASFALGHTRSDNRCRVFRTWIDGPRRSANFAGIDRVEQTGKR